MTMAMFVSRRPLHGIVLTALICGLMLTSTVAFVLSKNSGKMSNTSSLHMTLLTAGGKKVEVPAGSSLKAACAKLGVKPRYSCLKGDCGSCTVSVGGSRIKACVGKVPPQPKLKSLQEKGLEVK
ncbi:hypothetical protein ACHAW6_002986 [Cyclotella cf. meneghiniana]